MLFLNDGERVNKKFGAYFEVVFSVLGFCFGEWVLFDDILRASRFSGFKRV